MTQSAPVRARSASIAAPRLLTRERIYDALMRLDVDVRISPRARTAALLATAHVGERVLLVPEDVTDAELLVGLARALVRTYRSRTSAIAAELDGWTPTEDDDVTALVERFTAPTLRSRSSRALAP